MITKWGCRRRALQQYERGLHLRSQSDRTDGDLHETWALNDQADAAFQQAEEFWALASGSIIARLKWRRSSTG